LYFTFYRLTWLCYQLFSFLFSAQWLYLCISFLFGVMRWITLLWNPFYLILTWYVYFNIVFCCLSSSSLELLLSLLSLSSSTIVSFICFSIRSNANLLRFEAVWGIWVLEDKEEVFLAVITKWIHYKCIINNIKLVFHSNDNVTILYHLIYFIWLEVNHSINGYRPAQNGFIISAYCIT